MRDCIQLFFWLQKMKNNFLALCGIGCETIVSNELKKNGFKPFDRLTGCVFFSSNDTLLSSTFKANFFLRTVDRVLLVLAKKKITDFDSFFSLLSSIEWEAYFNKKTKIVIDKVSSFKSKLASEHTLQTMAHKAICSRLCSLWHMHSLTETGVEQKVRIYLNKDELSVCLDTSGEALYKRGYRLAGGAAPLRETIAASLLHFMQWKRKYPLHDSFAGSGTILIEALYYALNIPSGINRHFAFEHFSLFDSENLISTTEKIKEQAINEIRTDCLVRISGSDLDSCAVSLANANIERACKLAGYKLADYGCTGHIVRPEVLASSFEEFSLPPHEDGMLISNLPYGKRLLEESVALNLYIEVAKKVKTFKNWKIGLLTDKEELKTILKKEGMEAKSHPIKEGHIQTYFYTFTS